MNNRIEFEVQQSWPCLEAPGYELREVSYSVAGEEFYREEVVAEASEPYSGSLQEAELEFEVRKEFLHYRRGLMSHPDRPCFVLMAGRHEVPPQDGMPLVDGCWFQEWDFADRMGKGGLYGTNQQGGWDIDDLAGKSVDVVVTGLSPALLECITEAKIWGIDTLTFWHWDRDTQKYWPQVLEL